MTFGTDRPAWLTYNPGAAGESEVPERRVASLDGKPIGDVVAAKDIVRVVSSTGCGRALVRN